MADTDPTESPEPTDPAESTNPSESTESTDFSDSPGFTATGAAQDWEELVDEVRETAQERLVVNLGPQHPSTHGVLRLILELEGETVIEARCGIGYLHTGIEKSCEYRTWTQGVTFVTRADYLAPMFNEVAYCLGTEALLGAEEQVPERANVIRVLLMELGRISSHLVAIATAGMELGAITVMTVGFRERELILDMLEAITGNRMNHAYVRPGGVVTDLPPDAADRIRELLPLLQRRLVDYHRLLDANPIFLGRTQDVAYLDTAGCIALGVTGPVLRATGLPHDLRKSQPYCGYQDYEFDVPTATDADAYSRYRVRLEEMYQSLRIVEQCLDRLRPGPVMVADPHIAWPARLALGGDGQGIDLEHVRHIMAESMESLIFHFKLVTEGFQVPAGQVYTAIEGPRGELGAHLVSDEGTRPYRVHLRDPSFANLQALPALVEGGLLADVIAAISSLDPVLGGVDR